MHECDKRQEFEEIKTQIKKVQYGLNKHIDSQVAQDKQREENRFKQRENDRIMNEKLDEISKQLAELSPTVKGLQELEKAGATGMKVAATIVKLFVMIGVIAGSIYSLKEWLKH